MTEATLGRDPLDILAEEFVERFRKGERPSLDEYARAHPELADEIRAVFPALRLMEAAAEHDGDSALDAVNNLPPMLGEFRLLREIGRGGMGIVFEAEQVPLGRRVALKVLLHHGPMMADQRERFLREAQAAAQLQHANIVPVFGAGVQDGIHFYAMQFIAGQGLDRVLSQERRLTEHSSVSPMNVAAADAEPGIPQRDRAAQPNAAPLSFREAARIGLEVAEALAYAHAHGVVHRDIKPSNLLRDEQGTVWVTDFGLAKNLAMEPLTQQGEIVGTLRFMAPERFAGWSDPRSDVYGLGMTLYELLTLTPAFRDSDQARLIHQVTHVDPPAPRLLNRRIPIDLETIVVKAIAKETSQRYLSAAELAADLRRFLADEPIKARRATTLERTWQWCRRNPALARLVGAVGALLLVIAIGSSLAALWLGQERDEALKNLERARLAEQDSRDAVKNARAAQERERTARRLADRRFTTGLLAQAQAKRRSGKAGQRREALTLIAEAAPLARELDLGPGMLLALRNEAIASMALADLRPGRSWPIPLEGAKGIAFDADLSHYAYGDDQGLISVRRVSDDGEVCGLPGFGWTVYRLHFSPGGGVLAALYERGRDAQVCLWDLRLGKQIFKVSDAAAKTEMDFCRDGSLVALGASDGSVRIHALPAGEEVKRLSPDLAPKSVRFDPNGRQLAVANPGSGEVRLLDVESGQILRNLSHDRPVWTVCWSNDGRLLATGCDDWNIYLWDAATGEQTGAMKGHLGAPVILGFNRASDLLLSYGWDNTTRLWNVRSGRELVSIPADQAFPAGRFHVDKSDRLVPVAVGGSKLGFLEVSRSMECRQLIGHQPCQISGLDVRGDGRLLVSSSGLDGTRLWDLATGQTVARLPVQAIGARFSADGKALITTGKDGLLTWPIRANTLKRPAHLSIGPAKELHQGHGSYEHLALSRDTALAIVSVRDRGEALLVDRRSAVVGAPLRHRNIRFVAASPDGRWVATGAWHGTEVKIWDAVTGTCVQVLPRLINAELAFSSDSRWLATGGNDEATVRGYTLWEVGGWQRRYSIPSDPTRAPMGGMAFAPGSDVLALIHSARAIKLVDAPSGRELATLTLSHAIAFKSLAFDPAGATLVASTNAGEIYVWDLRRIRARLASMGLDWNEPAYAPLLLPAAEPLTVEVIRAAKSDSPAP